MTEENILLEEQDKQEPQKKCQSFAEFTDYLHRILDGSYIGSSMISYGARIRSINSRDGALKITNTIYSFKTAEEIALVAAENAFFILLSVFFNKNKNKKNRILKHFDADNWQKIRGFASGAKNGRHATVNMGYLVGHISAYHIFNPIALGIGAVYAVVLAWYQHQFRLRDRVISDYQELLAEIKKTKENKDYDLKDLKEKYNELDKKHEDIKKILVAMCLAAAIDGWLDGMYGFGNMSIVSNIVATVFFHSSHFTLFTLAATNPHLAIVMVAVIITVAVFSFIFKMIEEYCKQQELKQGQYDCAKALGLEKNENNIKYWEPENETLKIIYRTICAVGRAFINGIKNATAAASQFIKSSITFLALGSLYGVYLVVQEVRERFYHTPQDPEQTEKPIIIEEIEQNFEKIENKIQLKSEENKEHTDVIHENKMSIDVNKEGGFNGIKKDSIQASMAQTLFGYNRETRKSPIKLHKPWEAIVGKPEDKEQISGVLSKN